MTAVAVVATTALGLWACGSSTDTSSKAGSSGTGSVAPALTSTGRPVPDPLDELEAQSEDIIDIVPGGRWDDVAQDVATVDRAWKAYEPQASADGAPTAIVTSMGGAVAALDAASRAQQATETMQAANDLSAGVVELYGLYDIGRPVGIGRLDVIGRQIVFDAAAKDKAKVVDQVAAAAREVAAIEPDLRDHDGTKVLDQAHDQLAAMSAAAASGDFATVTAQATAFLETVDDMERLY